MQLQQQTRGKIKENITQISLIDLMIDIVNVWRRHALEKEEESPPLESA